MSHCRGGCGARLDARNKTGFCRPCGNALPLAERLPADRVVEIIKSAPQLLLRVTLEQQGYQVVPPGGQEV